MNKTLLKNIVFTCLLVSFAAVGDNFAQTQSEPVKQVNFRYSQNPKTKSKTENQKSTANAPKIDSTLKSVEENLADNETKQNTDFESRSVAAKTLEVAKRANTVAVSPTEVYKIGIGDVLLISLQNAPGKAANYFTVLTDGTIDYPLAGEMVSIQGLTAEEAEDLLKEKIKLYENPQVVVKVREFASHTFTVLGLVEKAGEKFLQREAMPLYVIRAEAIVQPRATAAFIKRANAETEKINLNDPKSDDILIFPGDIVEFKSIETDTVNGQTPQFYYIGGNVNSGGKKDFHQGITLTQAILACGGLRRSNVKKVVLRRKNQEGLLSPLEFDLNAIKNGNQPDPILQAGDTIEIGN